MASYHARPVEVLVLMRHNGRFYQLALDRDVNVALEQRMHPPVFSEQLREFFDPRVPAEDGIRVTIEGLCSNPQIWEDAREWNREDPERLGTGIKGLLSP